MLSFDPHSPRIRLAHRRLADAYARVPGADVPVVEPGVPHANFTEHEKFLDLDRMLEHAASWANALAASENDWPPFLNTFCTVVMVPEALGTIELRDKLNEIGDRLGVDILVRPIKR